MDKSKDFAVVSKETYHQKLGELLLGDPNFEKIHKLSIEDEISRYNTMRENTMDPYLSDDTIKLLKCQHSISDFYGLLKRHKENLPIRPIATSYNSLISNVENFLANMLKPLLKKCKYLIDSPRNFKSRTKLESFRFNPRLHTVISYDCKSLFTRVKVSRVISWILDEVYKNPRDFFNEKHNGVLLEPPSRSNFRKFLHSTLTDFNFFKSQIGIFKQKEGLPMGSCLSPLLANLFVNVFETSVIDKLMNEGKVLHWTRYVDDVFAIVMKNSEDFIFGKLNNWDSNLEFTREVMTSEGLVFLDCLVFANGHKLHHKKYRKEGLNTVLSNFEKSVMCKKYLKNSLFTMLHRERDCCSNNELFHESLEELREILRRNNYPKRLVDNKIKTFLKDDKKPDRPEKVHTLCIPYTSPSIEKYLHSLIKRMKMFVPYFEVNLAYKTPTLRDIISPYC